MSTDRSTDGSDNSSDSLPSTRVGSSGESSTSCSHSNDSDGGTRTAKTGLSLQSDVSTSSSNVSCSNGWDRGTGGSSSSRNDCSHDGSSGSSSSSSSNGSSSSSGGVGSPLEASTDDNERCVPHQARAQLLGELHATPLYQMVLHHVQQLRIYQGSSWDSACSQVHPSIGADAGSNTAASAAHTDAGAAPALPGVAPSPGYIAEKAAVLLLLQTPSQWGVQWPSHEAAEQWACLMDVSAYSILDAELAFLREQWRHIADLDGMYGAAHPDTNIPGKV